MTLQATELVRPRAAPGAVPHGYDATDYGTPARGRTSSVAWRVIYRGPS